MKEEQPYIREDQQHGPVKVGLMYPSDYGYATSGGTTKDRTACLAKELLYWDSSDFSDCKANDYLYNCKSLYQLTLAPYSAVADRVFYVGTWTATALYITAGYTYCGASGTFSEI